MTKISKKHQITRICRNAKKIPLYLKLAGSVDFPRLLARMKKNPSACNFFSSPSCNPIENSVQRLNPRLPVANGQGTAGPGLHDSPRACV